MPTTKGENIMFPPFDSERNRREDFESPELGVPQIQDQDVEVADTAEIAEVNEEFVEEEESKEEVSARYRFGPAAYPGA